VIGLVLTERHVISRFRSLLDKETQTKLPREIFVERGDQRLPEQRLWHSAVSSTVQAALV